MIQNASNEEFRSWLEKVDPTKLNFLFLLSLIGGGSYDTNTRIFMLLELIDPSDYDYDALFYFRATGDRRGYGYFDKLIEKVPEEKRVFTRVELLQEAPSESSSGDETPDTK